MGIDFSEESRDAILRALALLDKKEAEKHLEMLKPCVSEEATNRIINYRVNRELLDSFIRAIEKAEKHHQQEEAEKPKVDGHTDNDELTKEGK